MKLATLTLLSLTTQVISVSAAERRVNGFNDSAIMTAINASAAGDTIVFPGGVYTISSEMFWKGDRIYRGESGSILRGRDPRYGNVINFKTDNITITGLTFEGGGIFMDHPGGGMNSRVIIDRNIFRLNTSGDHNSAIKFTSGLQDSAITNNYFTGFNGGFAMYGYNYRRTKITNNEIVDMGAGMHIDAHGNSGELLVEQNFIRGVQGMGMEFQGACDGCTFIDNWFEHPSYAYPTTDSRYRPANGNSMAYSLILDKSRNIQILRNVMIAPRKGTLSSSNDYLRITFEVGGDNAFVEDNYNDGGNHVLAMNDGFETASVTVRNNLFKNYAQAASCSFCSATRSLTISNTGPNVQLSSTMSARLTAMEKPGIGKRYGSTPTPTPTPVPENSETPLPTEADSKFISDMTFTSVNGWGPVERDMSNGEKKSGDGKKISIAGVTYDKGLGVHANGSITLMGLAGTYESFKADLGIDDETGGHGSARVEIYADGRLAYSSPLLKGGDAATAASVDIRGADSVQIRFNNAGDNSNYDHVDIAHARLVRSTLEIESPNLSTQRYVSDMELNVIANGWGSVERDRSNGEWGSGDGNRITLNEEVYDKGLGVHANSDIRISLNGGFTKFESDIGVDDEVDRFQCGGNVVFQVYADNALLYDSGVMTKASATKSLSVDVSNRNELRLVVNSAADGKDCDHADWADARLTSK